MKNFIKERRQDFLIKTHKSELLGQEDAATTEQVIYKENH